MTRINDLPVDCLNMILSRVPAQDLLHFDLVCQRWTEPLSVACGQVRSLSLHGSDSMIHKHCVYGSMKILQAAHQQHGIRVQKSINHVVLQKYGLSAETVQLLHEKFPNVQSLELVQMALDQNQDSLARLLTQGPWNLTKLAVFHERNLELNYFEDTKENSDNFRLLWAKSRIRQLANCLDVFLSNVLDHLQGLRSLTLVDFTIYSGPTKCETVYPNLSNLSEFHLIRPHDCSKLLNRTFNPTTHWTNIRQLSLESKMLSLLQHFDTISNHQAVDGIFGQLTHLTISGMFPDILPSLITRCCATQLTYLNLIDIDVPLVGLLPNLRELDALRHLRIMFDVAIVVSQWTTLLSKAQAARPINMLPQLGNLRILQLENSDVIHQSIATAPLIQRCFPGLEQLILERDSRMLGFTCFRCHRQGIFLHEACKRTFLQSFITGRQVPDGALPELRKIKVQVKETFESEEQFHQNPQWLDQYEVYDCAQQEWIFENIKL